MQKPYVEERLGYGAPVPIEAKEGLIMFLIFGDESGKLQQGHYTSFCGYVAHVSTWNVFNDCWNKCRFRWQVPPIHMARIMHPDRKPDEWKETKKLWGAAWDDKRKVMLKEFSEIIQQSGAVCVGGIVDAAYFKKVADSDPIFKTIWKDPVYMSLHSLLMRGIDKTEIIDKHSAISLVVDDDEEFATSIYKHLNCFKKLDDPQLNARWDEQTKVKLKRVKERIKMISFADDSTHPGLQAADMIAYETRRMMIERINTPGTTSELYERLTFFGSNQPKFYRPEDLDTLQERTKEAIANGVITV